jgi:hypothetical protein
MEDTDFTVGHGFRCLLPDFRLFVEPTAYGWEALIYEEPVRKYREPIHKQFFGWIEQRQERMQIVR